MRKLTKSEKSLLGALAIAAIAAGYNYLFWEPMTAKIEADKTEISGLQPVYDDYQQKIKALPDLKKQLETIKDQPSNEDKFFTADENVITEYCFSSIVSVIVKFVLLSSTTKIVFCTFLFSYFPNKLFLYYYICNLSRCQGINCNR